MSKKNIRTLIAWSLCALAVLPLSLSAAPASTGAQKNLKVGVINFKKCVEDSKLGKQEQAGFDTLKKQLESTILEKEKVAKELSAKFNDSDYMDSLAEDASRDLKHKFKTLSNELMQMQNQYMQILQQANFKIIQKLSEKIQKASSTVAAQQGLDLVLNEETTFYHNKGFDVSDDVTKALDVLFDQENSSNADSAKK